MMNDQFKVAPLLKRGKNHAIKAPVLCEQLKIDGRELRYLVSAERIAGALILSGPCGYYLPANRDDCESFVALMISRAKSTFLMIKGVREALKQSELGSNLYHQLTIEEILRSVNDGEDLTCGKEEEVSATISI